MPLLLRGLPVLGGYRLLLSACGRQSRGLWCVYSRSGVRRQALPAVRVHLTFDEPVLTTREIRAVEPPCPGLDPFRITAYSLQEVVAEKLRALLQQQEKWRSGIRMT